MKGLWLRLLRAGGLYRVLRPLLALYLLKERNRPYRIWVSFLCRIFEGAYGRKRPVVWVNAFFPVEAIYALGAVPFIPEIYASLVAYFDLSRGPIALGGTKLSTDLCSFFRCVMGLAEEGVLPEPDLVISSSHLCDGANKFFSELARFYAVDHLFLDPPYGGGDKAKVYLLEQLRYVMEEASRRLGLPLRDEALSLVLHRTRHIWHFMQEVNRLRQGRPSPFAGSEGLSYVAGMAFYSPGSEEGVEFFRALRDHIAVRVRGGKGYLPRERFRVLWLHHIRPYYPNSIFSFLDARGIAVAFEEPNYLWWPEPRPEAPWESLTDKLLCNPWAGPLERRLQAVREMALSYGVQGAIHFSHWGCRQSTGGAVQLGEALKEMGLLYLLLPGDGADPGNYSPGQTLTRLQAFAEMLESR